MSTGYVVVRGQYSGVTVGRLVEWDRENGIITLDDARQVWRWRGANTLHEMASEGINVAQYSRVSAPATCQVHVIDAVKVIDVEPRALASLTTSVWND
jgi:ligand-binding sensor protein